ncbi:MAG: hypothetical protein K1X74_21180 [Pirellulales bacterium]|nr:hypothetical protein [Pirellulales bacterium]
MNFYAWIREGVRRAVLLGVSDAVDQLGTPNDENGDLNHNLLAILRDLPQRPVLAAATGDGAAMALGHESGIGQVASSVATALADDEPDTTPRRGSVQPLGAKRKRLGRSLSQVVDRPADES